MIRPHQGRGMAQEDPRKPSFLDKLLRRPAPQPEPEPIKAPEPEEPKRRQARRPARAVVEPAHVAAAFYTGQQPRQARRPVRAAFEDHSESGRIKREEEFNRRFKGEIARAEALGAIDDAAIVKAALQKQHIERMREWKQDLHFLVSSRMPVPPEAGRDINRRHDELFEQFDREMQEVDDQLKRVLDRAEAFELAEDRKRQKLIGYTPNRPRDFREAAALPMPFAQEAGRPPGAALVHPFNDAATRPETVPPSLQDAFNDAVAAPDSLTAWFAHFSQSAPAPDPGREPPAPSR